MMYTVVLNMCAVHNSVKDFYINLVRISVNVFVNVWEINRGLIKLKLLNTHIHAIK